MKKSITFLVILLFASLFTVSAFAHTGEVRSVDVILDELLQEQGVSEVKELNCDEITDEHFGELGDAAMSVMHPDQEQHTMMDTMMGGEGSENLEVAHIMMGKNYIGCLTGVAGDSGQTMMDIMMKGKWSFPFGFNQTNNPMMNFGFSTFGWFGWIFMILWWVLIIAGIVALVRWLVSQSQGGASKKSALDILKERYAKGEIDKKEFEEKSREIKNI